MIILPLSVVGEVMKWRAEVDVGKIYRNGATFQFRNMKAARISDSSYKVNNP
jgi:hypothetical protein